MKKAIIASAIAVASLGMMNTASAANGEVQFVGAVTSVTCDLQPEVGGSVSNVVQLGTAKPNNPVATPVSFTLAPEAGNTACTNLTNAADITWAGNFGANGLENQNGTATGAYVKLTAKGTSDVVMKGTTLTAEFSADQIKAGAVFDAELNGGTAPGDFKSAAAFVVAYK
ncbi:fimbrial protein [Salmonella enterica]|nr:fimbrial protein [Salmonella enterica]